MRRGLIAASSLSLILLLCLPPLPTVGRLPVPKAAAPTLDQATWSYFVKNCVSCHDAETRAGSLNLQSLRRSDSLVQSRVTWESVVRKIQTGEMPPKGSPQPDRADSAAVVHRIQAEFDRIDRSEALNPGSVTAHRLNRAEYNNTVRDLLGVDFHPADDFPQDDSGYGFDNIGDVLSLSTSQMEKYLTAAERIARTAVFGPESLTPTLTHYEDSGRDLVPVYDVPASYDTSGLTLPNSLHATHRFPVDGEYLFRFGLDGDRPLGSSAAHLCLWIDGRKVRAFDYDPTGSAAFVLDRQSFSDHTQECRCPVTAGDHWVAVTIERLYEGLPVAYGGPNPSTRQIAAPAFKPRPDFTPEKLAAARKRFEDRQKEKAPTNAVRIRGLDIGGPYGQKKGASEATLRRIFVCGSRRDAAATRKVIGNLVGRAFRRPATPREIDRFAGLVALAQHDGDSYEEGICLALQGILVSPEFLFRIEHDPASASTALSSSAAAAGTASGHPVNSYELASRLSYFLWSTMPDDELRACAERQTLRNPGVLEAQVRRMLADPRSNALAENFAGQWLQFRSMESVRPDKARFPGFDAYLRMSMREETETFFDRMIRNDRSVLDLLDGKYTYLNERLARFYGIPGVIGPAFRKVDLTGTPRGGILTQASVLTVTSYPNRTSPVLRGKWVLENLFNAAPPPPPPGVPNLDVSAVGSATSLRQQLEQHRKNPTCASCHARMDPLGFGLENFDAIGRWRRFDGSVAIDSSGSLPDGRKFQGPDGLRTILHGDREAFVQCLSAKMLTYALGRGLERYDRGTVKQIARNTAAHDYRFSDLVLGIVSSRPFQMRKGNGLP